jgi:2-C-methyl-D-erythritol 2,4-cyclodiphosphate synthase
MRVGIGYDVHKLAFGRKLIVGGVPIAFEKGLLGHSDADVLIHAICDAIFGAAGLGDIGEHFPDTDMTLKDISSLILLAQTVERIHQRGHRIANIDATVFAEAPKLMPYRAQMIRAIASAAGVSESRVNIKATSTEGLGAIGRGEGIGAMSVVLLEPDAVHK